MLIHYGFALVGKWRLQSSHFTGTGRMNAANVVAMKAGAVTKRAAGLENLKNLLSAMLANHISIKTSQGSLARCNCHHAFFTQLICQILLPALILIFFKIT